MAVEKIGVIGAGQMGTGEDLARAGVERQVLIEDQLPVLQRSLAEQSERGRELEGYITALVAKRREMEDALKAYIASTAQAGSTTTSSGKASNDARVEQAQAAFDRVMSRQVGITGTVGAPQGDAQKLKELADLARNNRVDERLAAIKARLEK